MPKTKEYMTNKNYYDTVYAWLQVHSSWSPGDDTRWIATKDVKFVQIADDLGISRQTASKKFKELLEIDGLVVQNDSKKRYDLPVLSKEVAWLIENGTLRMMVNALSENCINVYIYLFNRYWAAGQEPYDFTLAQVKKNAIGGGTSRSTDYVVTDILSVLSKLELIEYELTTKFDETTKQYKSVYTLKAVYNQIRVEC